MSPAMDPASPALSTHGLNKSFGSLVVARDIAIGLPQGALGARERLRALVHPRSALVW